MSFQWMYEQIHTMYPEPNMLMIDDQLMPFSRYVHPAFCRKCWE